MAEQTSPAAGQLRTERAEQAAGDWLSVPEKGALLGIRFVFLMARFWGRFWTRLFLKFLAFYYAAFDKQAAAASRKWWAQLGQEDVGFKTIYQHFLRFSHVTLDRVFLLQGRLKYYQFTRDGLHHLEKAAKEKKGGVLLGAHLGSWEAMRLGGAEDELPINIVGNFANAKMVNAVLSALNPTMANRVISIEAGNFDSMLKVKECVERGEFVAIMGDRVAEGQPVIEAEFMGETARFPAGPFLLASLLKCPIYLTFGLYSEPNGYALSCEPFCDRVVLPRRNRNEALREHVQRYAKVLEAKARQAPDNWFNFYDFWSRS